MSRRLALPLILVLLPGLVGCGKKEVTVVPADPASERADAPVDPPRGWRTHVDRRAGFTIAFPRSWDVRRSAAGTLASSRRNAIVVSLHADRSEEGRTTPADEYALATLEALPGYRSLEGEPADAPDSPYEAARAAGSGIREESERRQRVSVTVLRRPGSVTYTAVAFSDPQARSERRALDRALSTLRGRPPAG